MLESDSFCLPISLSGRRHYFDEKWYLRHNPDVQREVGKGTFASGLEHLFRIGHREIAEGRRELYRDSQAPAILRDETTGVTRRGKDLALFAHYDHEERVDPYVWRFLGSLKANGCDIVFVSAGVGKVDERRLRGICRRLIFKTDAGRDFGSWALAVRTLGTAAFEGYEYVYFVNDSVYWPVADAARFFDTMRDLRLDFWGGVDSVQGVYHIQSWFLAFSKSARAALFPVFLDKERSLSVVPKSAQIPEFELWFTQEALRRELSVGAYCAVDDIREDLIRTPVEGEASRLRTASRNSNPSLDAWKLLIQGYGNPGLKVELLRDDPTNSADLPEWKAVVEPASVPIIEAHQTRLGRCHPAGGVRDGSRVHPAPAHRVETKRLELLDRIEGTGLGAGERLVLLAHYDRDRVLDPHVQKTIESLTAAGADVALISGSLDDVSIGVAKSVASEILIKTDTARDFGSWFLAVRELRTVFSGYQDVIWMNDSTYFPLFEVREMIEKMSGVDFWGVVDSHNVRWHVMSWFWSFSKAVVKSDFFSWYLDAYSPKYSKWDQIRNYEMRIPWVLKKCGFDCRAYVSADQILESERIRAHPRYFGRNDFTMTHDFWDVLIEDFRVPALKVELLRDNPLSLPLGHNFSRVLDVVGRRTDYDPSLIVDHQKRIRATPDKLS